MAILTCRLHSSKQTQVNLAPNRSRARKTHHCQTPMQLAKPHSLDLHRWSALVLACKTRGHSQSHSICSEGMGMSSWTNIRWWESPDHSSYPESMTQTEPRRRNRQPLPRRLERRRSGLIHRERYQRRGRRHRGPKRIKCGRRKLRLAVEVGGQNNDTLMIMRAGFSHPNSILDLDS